MTTIGLQQLTAYMAIKRSASFSDALDTIAALRQARIELGEDIVIVGDGPQAYVAYQMAQINGAATVERIRVHDIDAFANRCADVLIYTSPDSRSLGRALHIARNGGRVLLINSQHDMLVDVDVYRDIHKRSLQLICAESYVAASGNLIDFVQHLCESGQLKLDV